jgi:hypothetical protein
VAQNVAEGKGVVTSHDVPQLYGGPPPRGGGHVVIPTAIEYDGEGKPVKVYVNDTNQGAYKGTQRAGCRKEVPAGQYKDSLRENGKMNVTNDPVWK